MSASEPEASRPIAEPHVLIAVDRSARAYARAFPYLQWRYGEHGDGFVRSDNAHLVALAEHDPEEFFRQVRWTADLLSERGMPRWMLEIDLSLMSRATARLLPDRPDISANLQRGASELAHLRRRAFTELGFRRCARTFAEKLGFGLQPRWVGFGCILASAVADERAGLSHAVVRVHEWAGDRRRFGPRWIAAVDGTISHARRL